MRDQGACRGFSDEGLQQANVLSYRKTYVQGQNILRQGDSADWCGVIVSGVVKLVKTSPDGRQQIVGLQFGAEFLGQLDGETTLLSAEAATDVELCCFSLSAFSGLRARNPGLEGVLLHDVMRTLDVARDWMFVLGRKTAEEKLASFLVFIAGRLGPLKCIDGQPDDMPAPFEGELPLSRTEISQFLGLRIETVSRHLGKLRADGIIETQGSRGIKIFDLPRLTAMADRDDLADCRQAHHAR